MSHRVTAESPCHCGVAGASISTAEEVGFYSLTVPQQPEAAESMNSASEAAEAAAVSPAAASGTDRREERSGAARVESELTTLLASRPVWSLQALTDRLAPLFLAEGQATAPQQLPPSAPSPSSPGVAPPTGPRAAQGGMEGGAAVATDGAQAASSLELSRLRNELLLALARLTYRFKTGEV